MAPLLGKQLQARQQVQQQFRQQAPQAPPYASSDVCVPCIKQIKVHKTGPTNFRATTLYSIRCTFLFDFPLTT